jgi:outer membrane lipoprotein LolB
VFSSPLGNEVARIESVAGGGVVLQRGGAGREEAPSFAALTERVLGVALDPAQMSAWLHGQSVPRGLPDDWSVTIDERQAAGAIDLAKRITATRGDVMVRLFVEQYRPLQE